MELSGAASILLTYKTNGGGVRGTVEGCPNGFPRSWLFGIFDQTLLNLSAKITVRVGEATSADLRAVSADSS
jgi:hypothetical protein